METFHSTQNPDPSDVNGLMPWAMYVEFASVANADHIYKCAAKAELSPASTDPAWQIMRFNQVTQEETFIQVGGKCDPGFNHAIYDGIAADIVTYLDSLTFFELAPTAP